MAMVDEGSTHPNGEAMFEELLWVHGMIRDNLQTIRRLISRIDGGAPAAEVRASLDELAATSVVWQLRSSCIRYCNFVHSHHHLEDSLFFPALCRANPALRTVVDKLQADHVLVSGYLDAVESAASRLVSAESARAELTATLSELSEHLLAHLDYEEAHLEPTLRRLKQLDLG